MAMISPFGVIGDTTKKKKRVSDELSWTPQGTLVADTTDKAEATASGAPVTTSDVMLQRKKAMDEARAKQEAEANAGLQAAQDAMGQSQAQLDELKRQQERDAAAAAAERARAQELADQVQRQMIWNKNLADVEETNRATAVEAEAGASKQAAATASNASTASSSLHDEERKKKRGLSSSLGINV